MHAFRSAALSAFSLLAQALLLAFLLVLWGCDPIVISRTDRPVPTKTVLTLTGLILPQNPLDAGADYPVSGLLEASPPLSGVLFSLWKGEAPAGTGTGVRIRAAAPPPNALRWDLRTNADAWIETEPSAQEGRYTLRIHAEAGDSAQDFSLGFNVIFRLEPKTAKTIVGIWRTELPIPTPDSMDTVKVTMQIDGGGSMVVAQRIRTGQPSPYDYVTISRENFDWTVENGFLLAKKTVCEYHDPATLEPTPESDCRPPLEEKTDIVVSNGVWTISNDGASVIFRKD